MGGLASASRVLISRLKMQPFIAGLDLSRRARYYTSGRGFSYGDEATPSNIASGNIAGIGTFIFLIILALILGVLLHRSVYGAGVCRGRTRKRRASPYQHGHDRDRLSSAAGSPSTVLFVFTPTRSRRAPDNFYEL